MPAMQEAAAKALIEQGCSRYSRNGSLAVRWYLSDAPAASGRSSQATTSATPLLVHAPPAGMHPQPTATQPLQKQMQELSQQTTQLHKATAPRSYIKSFKGVTQLASVPTSGINVRVAVGILLLGGYFVLLAAGY